MSEKHQISFIKKLPEKFLDDATTMLKDVSLMAMTLDSINVILGNHTQFQGSGPITIWFWDNKHAIRKCIHIDFKDGLIAHTDKEQWFPISIECANATNTPPSKISFSFDSPVPDGTQLISIKFFNKVNSETLSNLEEIQSYKHFLNGANLKSDTLRIEYDFINWIIFNLKGDQSIIIERDDQVGTFCIFFNNEEKTNQIATETNEPDWGKIELTEIFV